MRRTSSRRGFVKPVLNKKLALEAVIFCLDFIKTGKNSGLLINSMEFMKDIRKMIDDNMPTHIHVVCDYGGRIIFNNKAELRIFPKHLMPLARSIIGAEVFIASSEVGDPRLRCVEDIMLQ